MLVYSPLSKRSIINQIGNLDYKSNPWEAYDTITQFRKQIEVNIEYLHDQSKPIAHETELLNILDKKQYQIDMFLCPEANL